MDDNNDKQINYQEFIKAMRDYKIDLTENEVKVIFEEIDRDGSGNLSIDEIVRAIQVKKKLIIIIF
jgi:Ca2+-binding EF-hand superfamily protein